MSAPSNTRRSFLNASEPGSRPDGLGRARVPDPLGGAEGQAENRIALRSKMRQLAQTDVLIVGGGPAGIGAALGAARGRRQDPAN